MPEQIASTPKAEEISLRLMRLLQECPDLTQREQAQKLGISVGGVNYCLKALMEKGMVKMHNFVNSKNKFGYVYVLTPSGLAEKTAITHRFLQRKMTLCGWKISTDVCACNALIGVRSHTDPTPVW